MKPRMKLGDFLVAYLKRAGVTHLFGMPGDLVLGLFHRFGRDRDLEIVTFSHEPSVGFAADGYARSTRRLGVVCVTYGAGGHNVLNPIAGAYAEQVPLLVVSGGPGEAEQKLSGVHHQAKDVDGQWRMFREVTVDARILRHPERAAEEVHEVVRAIMTEHRPGYLEIHRDLVDVPIAGAAGDPRVERRLPGHAHPIRASSPRRWPTPGARLQAAKRPVLIGGIELYRDGAERDFLRLAERLGVPVVTTPDAKGCFPMDHPLHMGIHMGPFSAPAIEKRVRDADLVLALGTVLTDVNLGAAKPQVRRERAVWAVGGRVNVSFHTYTEVTLRDFVGALGRGKLPRFREAVVYRDNLERAKGGHADTALRVNDLLLEINDFLDLHPGYDVFAESGDSLFGGLELRLRAGGLYFSQGYYASMGFAVPAAIGAQIGTRRRTLVLCGDGAFQMTGPEISHAPRHGVAPIVVLVNNAAGRSSGRSRRGPICWRFRRGPTPNSRRRGAASASGGDTGRTPRSAARRARVARVRRHRVQDPAGRPLADLAQVHPRKCKEGDEGPFRAARRSRAKVGGSKGTFVRVLAAGFALSLLARAVAAAEPADGFDAVDGSGCAATVDRVGARQRSRARLSAAHGRRRATLRLVGPLALDVDAGDARFTQSFEVSGPGAWVTLPGDAALWPDATRVDGQPLAVVPAPGVGSPAAWLPRGRHQIDGRLALARAEPGAAADSRRHGARRPDARRKRRSLRPCATSPDGSGSRHARAKPAPEDHLEVLVYRRVVDSIPLQLETRLVLRVAGRAREIALGPVSPEGFVPLALAGDLPARLESDGRLRVQLRPGEHTVAIHARHEGPVAALSTPSRVDTPWAAEEVWVFDARPELRIAAVEGVAAIDPNQTGLPPEWQQLPAYLLRPGDTLQLAERRRGDPDPADHLSLDRTLWLDFDGAGLTFRDTIQGRLRRTSRLEMPEPSRLGRAVVGGRDWFLTQLGDGGATGVEIPPGDVTLEAEGRVENAETRALPAVGWSNGFDQLSGRLLLPPGWSLLHAFGVDRASPTWVTSWTLLDFFLVLIAASAAARLWGAAWGALALATLALTWVEPAAPRWVWLGALAGEALVRVLRSGRGNVVARGVRGVAWLLLALQGVPVCGGRDSNAACIPRSPTRSVPNAGASDGRSQARTAGRSSAMEAGKYASEDAELQARRAGAFRDTGNRLRRRPACCGRRGWRLRRATSARSIPMRGFPPGRACRPGSGGASISSGAAPSKRSTRCGSG